mmetsp:Transcript_42420/g.119995  ORF Transcript_42420/g.119995 Transcript_42420/m.119995 type:complete len:270 (+) Transcript_42420:685-1494(+)
MRSSAGVKVRDAGTCVLRGPEAMQTPKTSLDATTVAPRTSFALIRPLVWPQPWSAHWQLTVRDAAWAMVHSSTPSCLYSSVLLRSLTLRTTSSFLAANSSSRACLAMPSSIMKADSSASLPGLLLSATYIAALAAARRAASPPFLDEARKSWATLTIVAAAGCRRARLASWHRAASQPSSSVTLGGARAMRASDMSKDFCAANSNARREASEGCCMYLAMARSSEKVSIQGPASSTCCISRMRSLRLCIRSASAALVALPTSRRNPQPI